MSSLSDCPVEELSEEAREWMLKHVRSQIEYHASQLTALNALQVRLKTAPPAVSAVAAAAASVPLNVMSGPATGGRRRPPPPVPASAVANIAARVKSPGNQFYGGGGGSSGNVRAKSPPNSPPPKPASPPASSPPPIEKKSPPPVPYSTTKGKKLPPPIPKVGKIQARFPEPPNSPLHTSGAAPSPSQAAVSESTPRAKILYDFSSPDSHCLEVKKDWIVSIIRKDPSGWWKVEFQGKRGYIPSEYANEILATGPTPPMSRAHSAPAQNQQQQQPPRPEKEAVDTVASPKDANVNKIKKMYTYGSPVAMGGVDMSALAKGAQARRRQSAESREQADASAAVRSQPPPLPKSAAPSSAPSSSLPPNPAEAFVFAVAEYEYETADADDLPFREGDYVRVLSYDQNGWMTGEVRGRRGAFPSNYVRLVHKPADVFGQTSQAYQKTKPTELSFEKGEFLLLTTHGGAHEFWEAERSDGTSGKVPVSHIFICE